MPTNYTLSKTYDLSDKDTAYAMECFEHACKLIDKQVTSWDDMYATIGDVYKHFIGSPSPTSAIAATGLMYSFILAMQQMPDEGDILILAYRMMEIQLLRDDLTLLPPTRHPDNEAKEVLGGLVSLMAKLAAMEAPEGPETSQTTDASAAPTSTRTLH
jgi:hypothetical protein